MMKFPRVFVALLCLSAPVSTACAAPRINSLPRRSTCAPHNASDWFQEANKYLKTGQTSPGTRPAIWATVALVGLDLPETSGGRKPDRNAVWCAQGELTPEEFPLSVQFKGNLPLWINSGDKTPFPSETNSTLTLAIDSSGSQLFNWQISGRNRLGKGPQRLDLAQQRLSEQSIVFSKPVEFFGLKQVTLTLVRGEAPLLVGTAARNPVGVRYRITPTFVVKNSSDGIGDNTVEVVSGISFLQNNQIIGMFNTGGDAKAGKRLVAPSFEAVRLDGKPETYKIEIRGKILDSDLFKSDTLWNRPMSVPLKSNIHPDDHTIVIDPGFAPGDNDAWGNLELRIQKIGDVF